LFFPRIFNVQPKISLQPDQVGEAIGCLVFPDMLVAAPASLVVAAKHTDAFRHQGQAVLKPVRYRERVLAPAKSPFRRMLPLTTPGRFRYSSSASMLEFTPTKVGVVKFSSMRPEQSLAGAANVKARGHVLDLLPWAIRFGEARISAVFEPRPPATA
jgi:hypothetical protein